MPRRDAERQAASLLNELGIDTVPTPLEAIAGALDAEIVYQRMDNPVSGMTYRHGDHKVIGINNSHHPRRQRFTLAHELGHLVMHPGKPLLVDSSIRVDFRDNISSLATNTQEIEANAFAAALLMPEPAVRHHLQHLQANGPRAREPLTTELAAHFNVSNETMTYRLINLGLVTA